MTIVITAGGRASQSSTGLLPCGGLTRRKGTYVRGCPVIVGNTLMYMDRIHLTLEYTSLLAPVIGALADRALVYG